MTITSKTTGNSRDSRIVRAKVATHSGRYLQFSIDPRTHSEARYCVTVVNRLGVGVSLSTIVRLAIARYAADLQELHHALVLKPEAFGTIAEVEVMKKQLERANKGGLWREFPEIRRQALGCVAALPTGDPVRDLMNEKNAEAEEQAVNHHTEESAA